MIKTWGFCEDLKPIVHHYEHGDSNDNDYEKEKGDDKEDDNVNSDNNIFK